MHHQDNKLFSPKNIALIALFAVSAFALLYSPVRTSLAEGAYTAAVSVWDFGDTASNTWNSFITNFRSKEVLVTENKTLHEEVSRMQAQVLDRNLLAEKVATLEEALGRVRSDDRVVATVLAGPGLTPYDVLLVDAGTEQGISVGNMVVYAGSGVVGEIIESTPVSSKVKLLSSPGEEHAVIVGSHAIPVLAVGRGMGNFEAKVPQDSTVLVGDNVLLAKGSLILGVVSLVEEKPAEPFKRIFFRLPFNITEVQSVEVIK